MANKSVVTVDPRGGEVCLLWSHNRIWGRLTSINDEAGTSCHIICNKGQREIKVWWSLVFDEMNKFKAAGTYSFPRARNR